MYEFVFLFFYKFTNIQLCGCLPVGNSARNEEKQSNSKPPVKRYSLKHGMKKIIKYLLMITSLQMRIQMVIVTHRVENRSMNTKFCSVK